MQNADDNSRRRGNDSNRTLPLRRGRLYCRGRGNRHPRLPLFDVPPVGRWPRVRCERRQRGVHGRGAHHPLRLIGLGGARVLLGVRIVYNQ